MKVWRRRCQLMRRLKVDILITIVLAIALSVSCTVRPRGVLSERKMRELLVDLHRADGALQVSGVLYSSDEALAAYYQSVLEKYGVTQAQFDSSLAWYTDNPNLFDKMYPNVIAELEKQHQESLEALNLFNEQERQKPERLKELKRIMDTPLEHFGKAGLYDTFNTTDTLPGPIKEYTRCF